MMEAVYSGLPYPTSAELESLFKRGVPADAMAEPWPIKSAKVRFLNGGTFDFDREGQAAIIFLAEDYGEVIDLIAWQQKGGAVASWRGAAFCLGDTEHIFNPATYFADDALRIHRTPLDWLKASRDGICIVRSALAYAYLRGVSRVSCADEVYLQQVKRWVQAPKPTVKFLVEEFAA
jgi:hypothetical protein